MKTCTSLIRRFSSTKFSTKSIIKNVSPLMFYTTVQDTAKYQHFIPWCTKSTILNTYPTHQQTELCVSFGLYNTSYISQVYDTDLNNNSTLDSASQKLHRKIHSISRTSPFKELQSIWVIKSVENQTLQTWIEYSIQFQFRNFLYQNAAALAIDSLGKGMLQAFTRESLKRQALLSNQLKMQPNRVSQEVPFTSKQAALSVNSLQEFLVKHPKYKRFYDSNLAFRNRTDQIYAILRQRESFQERLVFQLDNLLLYMNLA